MSFEKKDYEFLLLATTFCSKIDNYISVLNITDGELDELREDTLQFANILTNLNQHSMLNEGLTNNKLHNMKIALSHLAQLCRNSKNYTVQIGLDLGIELPVYAFRAN